MAILNLNTSDCLEVVLIPWNSESVLAANAFQLADALGFIPSALDGSGMVVLSGIFSDDGAHATLEATNDEDEYSETIDGHICVNVKDRANEILTVRIKGCGHGQIARLIDQKKKRVPGFSIKANLAVPLTIQVFDTCTGYSLTTNYGWMLSNPPIEFGNNDSEIEIRFLMVNPEEGKLVSKAVMPSRVAEVAGDAIDTASRIIGI